LLEVNKQWDHQYRNVKLHYERKITEMKGKLQTAENNIRKMRKETERLQGLVQERETERHLDHTEEREREEQQVLEEEQRGRERLCQEMKEQNQLLQEQNASSARSKRCYQREIHRLNKVLSESLKRQTPPPQHRLDPESCNPEEMRTQIEVLQQQVQIYEEDFKKERSDRERLGAKKELLQAANERLRRQLSRLSCQAPHISQPEDRLHLPPHLPPCANCGFAPHYLGPRTQAAAHPQQQWPAFTPGWPLPDVHQKANGNISNEFWYKINGSIIQYKLWGIHIYQETLERLKVTVTKNICTMSV
ncbi:TNFAIP3-interacting protein 3-like, partial [Microcaecilia unicolor]|uniref:TNFAIP3-interacting protein 3-like n=1 Tax=Microcaecilia unicolor TaxID=1415580 RepID=A0A6P7WY14_9AMPH